MGRPVTGDGAVHRDRAMSILRRQPIIDGHNDLPWAAREAADYDLTGST